MKFILKRLLTMLLTIWVITTLTFVIMHTIPGDPFSSDSDVLPEEVLNNMRAKFNLDKPLPVQYLLYLKNLASFDLGPSIESETRNVNTLIAEGLPVSALLGFQALVIALVFGMILGIIASLFHNRAIDYSAMTIAILGISVPSFILAPLLIKFFAVQWGMLPVASWGTWKHTILPSVALAAGPLAIIARFTRSSMLEVLKQNYMKTADAKGLGAAGIVIKHGIRNAIIPVVSFMGPLVAHLLTGTFVIEKIFAIPGLGKYFVDSIFNRDYPVILGTTIFFSVVLIVTLFLIDLSYRLIDPRIKLSSRGD
ncbi:ABC transporter permease [Fictibacillus enclensis]|uniref:ABC transporter permease n=1 Tax=Fictibacillus enclensis TaxID=1017270 RepID=UPI0025A240F0|nr:ABC transporter permease [Fictibacillus enclensis]MDM5337057.1 ABC transporter permease [Fictibacillus enclensis]